MVTQEILKNLLLQTDRFYLRPLTKKDASVRYLSWMADTVINKYIESAKYTNNLKSLESFVMEKSNKSDCLFLGIFLRQSHLHIGNIKYEPINFRSGYAVMGVMIGDINWRGKNVFSEVLKNTTEWLKKEFNINQIQLGVEKKNISAIKAYEKLGFTLCKESSNIKSNPNALKMKLLID